MTYNPFARGTYPVGVRTIEVHDEARARRIPVELWYPAAEAYRGKDLHRATCDRFSAGPGTPDSLQFAIRDAEAGEGRQPLILYSHAAASHRRDGALLGPHLASHGYIVAAPDYLGDTIAEVLADQTAVAGTPRLRATDEETVANRPRDAVFVLDRITAGVDPEIAARIDTEKIGTCGGSLGGWTSLRVSSLDARPKASFIAAPSWGFSGPFPQTTLQTSALPLDNWPGTVATFLIAGERDALVNLDDLRELYTRLQAPKRFAVLRGASHFHWLENAESLYESFRALWEGGVIQVHGADVVGLAKATPPFSQLCPHWHGTDTLQALCLAHMDAELKERIDARAFLDGNLARVFAARGIGLNELAREAEPVVIF